MSGDDLIARARAALARVHDPELPDLGIADLGILRGVSAAGEGVEVAITPTYSGCPAMVEITENIHATLAAAGIASVRVRRVLDPPWTTDWLSEEGRRKLAAAGIAPPSPGASPSPGAPPSPRAPACPRCASPATELISPFGATACKALWRCTACREPFDAFKCH